MKKEKQNLNESLSRIKNLFQHERGVVISEQSYRTLINEQAAKGDYSNPYTDSETLVSATIIIGLAGFSSFFAHLLA